MCYNGLMAAYTSSKRRCGGQHGNQNALRHGLYPAYRPTFIPFENSSRTLDLQTGIALIRHSMRRVLTHLVLIPTLIRENPESPLIKREGGGILNSQSEIRYNIRSYSFFSRNKSRTLELKLSIACFVDH